MNEKLIGKWIQNADQEYPGLWFDFKADGSFVAGYEALGIESGGTWSVDENKIEMDQTYHTFGLLGKVAGIFAIEGDQLLMAVVGADQKPPETLDKATRYTRA